MANIKLVIVPEKIKKSGECVVMLQLSAKHKTLRVPTEINVKPEYFVNGLVRGGAKFDKQAQIKNIRLNEIKNDCDLRIINNSEKVKSMDVQALKKFLFAEEIEVSTDFFKYTARRIEEMKQSGQIGTVGPLTATLNKVKTFWPKPELDFNDINIRWLEMFDAFCLKDKRKRNTIAFYFRYIRSMFNDAMILDDMELKYPFKKFKIAKEETRNRNLSIDIIRKLRDYKTEIKRREITRDIFSLQFYLFGINIKDLFYLLPSNVVDGRLQFYRSKSKRLDSLGRFYNIKLEPEALRLIEKYKGKKYLLWFADHSYTGNAKVEHARQTEFQYKNQDALTRMLNDNLTLIHDDLKINLPNPLTTYYVRHSFSTIMREIGISKDDISLCLGHVNPEQSMKVTGIYINEDFIRADQANRELINFANSEFSDGKSWKDHKEQISKKRTKKNPAT